MYILCIYCLLSILVPFQTIMASTPDDFWQEYRTAKKSGAVQNPVEHLKSLSTRLDSDTLERLESKKSAILWFIATGGKNGFRKAVATPAERVVLENALIFATIVHVVNHSDELLQIVVVRRDAEIRDEDNKTKSHLVYAQRVMTATRIMMESALPPARFKPYAQELFNKEYMPTIFHSKNTKSMSPAQWQQEAQKFADMFTRNIDSRVKHTLFENIQFSFNNPVAYLGFKEPVTETVASDFRQLVVESCMPDRKLFAAAKAPAESSPASQPISHRAMRIVTDNGLTIERGSNGSVKIVPQRDVKIGFMSLGAGSVMQAGTGISMGPIQLNNRQTEEEFLAAINAFSTIIEKTYI